MNVLISGGAGFIGSWLVDNFIERGDTVYVIDNLTTGKWSNISNIKHSRLDIAKMNVESEWLSWYLKEFNFDIVMHFASPASPTAFKQIPEDILNANIMGTRNMLEIANNDNARFIFASTSEVYGNPPLSALPLKETYNGNVNCLGERGCYDEGKRAGEAYCRAYERKYGMDIGIIRIFNTYGPRMPDDGRAIPTFIKNSLAKKTLPIFGSGEQTRAFLYIDDLISGIMSYALYHGVLPYPVNIGAINQTRLIDIAYMIHQMTGTDLDFKYFDRTEDDPDYRLPDITRINKLIGWKPITPLERGLKKTIEYFKKL
jgi:nucleoside-diphosphate-sugar epimerase